VKLAIELYRPLVNSQPWGEFHSLLASGFSFSEGPLYLICEILFQVKSVLVDFVIISPFCGDSVVIEFCHHHTKFRWLSTSCGDEVIYTPFSYLRKIQGCCRNHLFHRLWYISLDRLPRMPSITTSPHGLSLRYSYGKT
jgi:hypothetical protein